MAITVKQSLSIGGLCKCRLLSGSGGLNNVISYAGDMEIPDIKPWLVKNQLLVTTGYALRTNPQLITNLVRDLHEAGCSALAIKTRFTGPIPQAAIDLSNKLNLPLIEIPDYLPFIDIMNPLAKSIADDNIRLFEFSKNIHSQFIELEISGKGLEKITEMLSSLINSSVIITDTDYSIISRSGVTQTFEYLFHVELKEFDNFLLSNDTNYIFSYLTDSGSVLHYTIRKIILGNKIRGFIFISSSKLLNDMSSIIVDHASTVSALEFSKLDALMEQHKLMENNLLIDIITGNIKNEDEVTYRAINLKWPSPPFSLIIFDIDNFKFVAKTHEEVAIQLIKENIKSIIKEFLYKDTNNAVIINKSDSFNCIVPGIKSKPEIQSSISNIISTTISKLNINMTAGVCDNIPSYSSLRNSYTDTRDAITISRANSFTKKYAFISDIKLDQALLHLCEKKFFKSFVAETVEKLDEYDKNCNSDLLNTLNVLVNNMGIKIKTAEQLFIHRNTLTYRLKRIETITGYDLSNPNSIFTLGIALKAQPYIRLNKNI